MFAPLLTYLYSGELHITATNIWPIITAATQLDMPEALNLCEKYLQTAIKTEGEKEKVRGYGLSFFVFLDIFKCRHTSMYLTKAKEKWKRSSFSN